MVVGACNSGIEEAEAGGLLSLELIHNEFQVSRPELHAV